MKIILCLLLGMFTGHIAQAATALDRIKATNTINCGYVSYAPALVKDVKNGQWSGYDYDVAQAVANRLGLTAKHIAETGWATVTTDLDTHKFDMLCSSYWVNPKDAKFILFSRPIYYQPVFVVARAADKRFDKNIAAINDPAVRLVALDSDNPVFIAKTDFPKAKVIELPNMTDISQTLVNVADGKADVAIADAHAFGIYNDYNPSKLKIVNPAQPVRIYPASFAFQANDTMLRDAVNAALDELILDGSIARIMKRYEKYPHSWYDATISYNTGKISRP